MNVCLLCWLAYFGGQRRRVSLCVCVVFNYSVAIFDLLEPYISRVLPETLPLSYPCVCVCVCVYVCVCIYLCFCIFSKTVSCCSSRRSSGPIDVVAAIIFQLESSRAQLP